MSPPALVDYVISPQDALRIVWYPPIPPQASHFFINNMLGFLGSQMISLEKVGINQK